MFRLALRAVGAVCLLSVSAFPVWQTPVSAQAAPAASIEWVPFDQALKKAKADQKHVYIQFHATWCGYCKKLERETYSQPDIQKQLNTHFVPVRIVEGSDESYTFGSRTYTTQEVMARYKVTGYPMMVFLKPDGTLVGTLHGYLEPAQMKQALNAIQSGRYPKAS